MMMVKPQQSKGSIQVIERMMSLLDALAQSSEPATLKSLARVTGLHPSTAHRILAMMVSSQIVERQEAGIYTLGIRLLELGNVVRSRLSVREVALPFMRNLHDAIGESVNLGIRDRDEIVYVERTSSGRSLIRVVYLVGGRAPLHLTSLGKLFLAAANEAEVDAYAERTGLPGMTAHSLTRLDALKAELEKIRRDDLSFDNEEAEIGLRCVASPIRNDEGVIVAGLSISSPSDRHNPAWALQVKETADAVSRALGFRPQRTA